MYPRGLCKRLLIYLTFSILIACLAKDSKDLLHNTKLISDDLDLFQDGDLIFRSGKGIFSDFFKSVGTRKSPYSHVGIICRHGGEVFVIHTEANELTGKGHAKIDALNIFLNDSNASASCIYRLKKAANYYGKKSAGIAIQFAKDKIPFDLNFDISTQDKLYCTELVWLAFKKAGIDIVDSPSSITVPFLKSKTIITIPDILDSGKFEKISKLK